MLKNEKKQWISDDAYNFNRTNYRLPRSWMSKTILSTNDGKVILENFYDDEVERLISAISSSGLEIINTIDRNLYQPEKEFHVLCGGETVS